MSENNIHETQPEREQVHHRTEHSVDESLRSIQNIEGGGPIKKVDLSTMPRPIRFIGYFIISVSLLIGASMLLLSVFR